LFITRMVTPAMSAAMEPTDRSMPPEMMTKHMPTAMMPMKAVRVSTFRALSTVANSPLSSVPATHSSSRPSRGPNAGSRRARRRAAGGTGSVDRAVGSVRSGGMGDELLFAELGGAERGLQPAAAHHRHAVAQADQLH